MNCRTIKTEAQDIKLDYSYTNKPLQLLWSQSHLCMAQVQNPNKNVCEIATVSIFRMQLLCLPQAQMSSLGKYYKYLETKMQF